MFYSWFYMFEEICNLLKEQYQNFSIIDFKTISRAYQASSESEDVLVTVGFVVPVLRRLVSVPVKNTILLEYFWYRRKMACKRNLKCQS